MCINDTHGNATQWSLVLEDSLLVTCGLWFMCDLAGLGRWFWMQIYVLPWQQTSNKTSGWYVLVKYMSQLRHIKVTKVEKTCWVHRWNTWWFVWALNAIMTVLSWPAADLRSDIRSRLCWLSIIDELSEYLAIIQDVCPYSYSSSNFALRSIIPQLQLVHKFSN